ncbi:MAG: PspC domain-containing protein [Candidatus Zixiibacteriota bacterium]
MDNRLYRSRTDSTIAGVCGGLGEYFNIDPTIIRILFVLFLFVDGVSLLAYIIAWIIIPRQPLAVVDNEVTGATAKPLERKEKEYPGWNKYLPGGILIGIGVFFILREHYWWWHTERFWPLLLIGVGVFLLFRFTREKKASEQSNQSLEGGAHESGKI